MRVIKKIQQDAEIWDFNDHLFSDAIRILLGTKTEKWLLLFVITSVWMIRLASTNRNPISYYCMLYYDVVSVTIVFKIFRFNTANSDNHYYFGFFHCSIYYYNYYYTSFNFTHF